MQCIYAIINLNNGKKYIGSTNNLSRRRSKHFSLLKANKHPNRYLQAAFNKDKEENFKIIVLEQDVESNILREKELDYILKYNVLNNNFGYNLSSITKGSNKKYLKVYQYDLEGNFVNVFENCTKAAEKVLGDVKYGSRISACCREQYKFSHNFIWIYENKLDTLQQRVIDANNKRVSLETKEKMRNKKLGKYQSLESRQNKSLSMKGKNPSNLSYIQELRKVPVYVYDKDFNFLEEFECVRRCQDKYPCCGTYLWKNPENKICKKLQLYFTLKKLQKDE